MDFRDSTQVLRCVLGIFLLQPQKPFCVMLHLFLWARVLPWTWELCFLSYGGSQQAILCPVRAGVTWVHGTPGLSQGCMRLLACHMNAWGSWLVTWVHGELGLSNGYMGHLACHMGTWGSWLITWVHRTSGLSHGCMGLLDCHMSA